MSGLLHPVHSVIKFQGLKLTFCLFFFFFGQMKRYKSYLDYSVIIKARWKRSDSFCEQNKYNSQHTVAADAYILHIEFKRWVMSLLKEEHLSQEWLKSG